MRITLALSLLCAALLAGCATPVALNTLQYEGKPSVTSTKEATVTVVSNAVRGSGRSALVPVGKIFIPMSIGPTTRGQFNRRDQQAFAESLRAELVRLRIVKTASDADTTTADLRVSVIFAQTYHDPELQRYTLDVVMEMTGGKEPQLHEYKIFSWERDSLWERLNTNGYQGKEKAARMLLEKVIPDIELYIKSM